MPTDPAVAAPTDDTQQPAPDAGGDLSQGYCIEISVLPDGSYKVSGPEPLEADAAEDEGKAYAPGEDYPSIGAALKGVLDLIKQNPVGGDADKEFEAGYGAS